MNHLKKILYIILLFAFVSCEQAMIDSDTKSSRQEVTNKLRYGENDNIRKVSLYNQSIPPDISRLLVAPPPPPIGSGELISFSVTEEVPIKDVLIELGRIADLDIQIDPEISGGIIVKLTKKPLQVIIDSICELGNLRYTYKNNILRFEKDTPYTKNYDIDFLIDADIWGTLESSIKDIIDINKPEDDTMREPKIMVNKPASLISIYANKKTQQAISRYIDHVKINHSAQVLIEAKVVEVSLNRSFQMGVDWSFLNEGKGGITFGTSGSGGGSSLGGISADIKTAVFGGNLNAAINALDTFGTTKTLSSPRVHAMNNQTSELKFVNKLIYFSLEKEEEDNSDNNDVKTTYTSTKQEEEIGVTLTITPSINLQRNEITLNVTPDLKSKVGEVSDPTEPLNKVPLIQSKSVSTSLKIRSGSVLVIGGLMSEESSSSDTGVPFLSGMPLVGMLFKNSSRSKDLRETIIFIKATIIKPDGNVNTYDRTLYDYSYPNDKTNFFN